MNSTLTLFLKSAKFISKKNGISFDFRPIFSYCAYAHRFQRQFTVRFWVKHQNGLGSTLLALLHATDQGAISSRGICCLKPILIADYDVLIWLIFTFFSNS